MALFSLETLAQTTNPRSGQRPAQPTARALVGALDTVHPLGRVPLGYEPIVFSWKRDPRAQAYRVTLVRIVSSGGGLRQTPVSTVTLSPELTYTDQLMRMPATGRYRWLVESIGVDGTTAIARKYGYFSVEDGALRSERQGAIGGGYTSWRTRFVGKQGAYESDYSAGLAGPFISGSYGFAPNFSLGLEASRVEFSLRGTFLHSQSVMLSGNYVTSNFGGEKFSALVGVEGAYSDVPEVLPADSTNLLTGQLTRFQVGLAGRFYYHLDKTSAFFVGGEVLKTVSLKSASFSGVSTSGGNLAVSAGVGARLGLSMIWALGLDAIYVQDNSTYQGASALGVVASGVQFRLGLFHFFQSSTVQ